tara:strand:+ start:270 stop:1880 length:1611 start_codon:yes stop_codon:yes gene_type:complete
MYDEVMRRPMFQTPQQRQASGIMAGVAPVRGYADGDLVEDEDPSFMDIAQVMPGVMKDMVIGDDGTMSDFFSMDKSEEGQGLNARDLTDFFIVDPSDPVDVGIATATAGLMATGVGSPGAIAAQLGRLGFKGKKVADAVEKAVRLGVGETKGKTFGRGQTARIAPALLGSEQAMAAEADSSAGGIAALPVKPTGISVDNPVTAEEIEDLGITLEEFEASEPEVQQQYLDLLNDRRMAANVGYNVGKTTGGIGDVITSIPRLAMEGAEYVADSRFGRALGLSDPGDVDEDFEMFPMAGAMEEGARRNAPATMEQFRTGMTPGIIPQPEAPTPPPSVGQLAEEDPYAGVTQEGQAYSEPQESAPVEDDNLMSRIMSGRATEKDRIRLGANTSEGRSGRRSPNTALEQFRAGQEYDDALQTRDIAERTTKVAERGTAFAENLKLLKKEMPEASTDELINLLLSQSSDETAYERRIQFAQLKSEYFDVLSKNVKYLNDPAGASEEAARMAALAMNMPVAPSADDGSFNVDAEGNVKPKND